MNQSPKAFTAQGESKAFIQLCKILFYLGAFCMLFIMVITVIHSFGRYIFDKPLRGVAELSCFALVTAIFFVTPYVQAIRGHLSIPMFTEKFSVKTGHILDIVNLIVAVGCAALGTWKTIELGFEKVANHSTSSVLSIPLYPFLFVIAFGWLIYGLVCLMQIVHVSKIIRASVEPSRTPAAAAPRKGATP